MEWCFFVRETCQHYFLEQDIILGWHGENGYKKIVEIDENPVFKESTTVGIA